MAANNSQYEKVREIIGKMVRENIDRAGIDYEDREDMQSDIYYYTMEPTDENNKHIQEIINLIIWGDNE